MISEFSEFAYGYAVTEELIHRYGIVLCGAPYFPTAREEGRRLGYDLRLDSPSMPLFIQFKRTDGMVRRSANEIKDGLFQDPPIYRMKITPRNLSEQHSLLIELNKKEALVFYVAPRFHEWAEFNDYFMNQKVLQHSAFIYPLSIGEMYDDNQHHVAFGPSGRTGYLFSEPYEIDSILGSDDIYSALRQGRGEAFGLDSAIDASIGFMESIVKEYGILTEFPYTDSREDVVIRKFRKASFLARHYFQLHYMIAQFPEGG